jgi:hypothetical protein
MRPTAARACQQQRQRPYTANGATYVFVGAPTEARRADAHGMRLQES